MIGRTLSRFVMLNLFQHPFRHFEQALAARWMLKQVQHDKMDEMNEPWNARSSEKFECGPA